MSSNSLWHYGSHTSSIQKHENETHARTNELQHQTKTSVLELSSSVIRRFCIPCEMLLGAGGASVVTATPSEASMEAPRPGLWSLHHPALQVA